MTKNDHITLGELGETIACRYLADQGFTIKARNYRKKWGEIDIVSLKGAVTHFVEVKAVKRGSGILPEENLHASKIRKLLRVFESYALEKNQSLHSDTFDWQFDAILIELDKDQMEAHIRFMEDIVM